MTEDSSRKNVVLWIVIVTALIVTIGVLTHRCSSKPETKASAMAQQTSKTLATLALQHAGDQGRILLISPDPAVIQDTNLRAWTENQIQTLQRSLGSGAKLVGVETVAEGVRNRATGEDAKPFTLQTVAALVGKHPETTLVVSLSGAPTPEKTPAPNLPPFICFAPDGDNVAELMKQGRVVAAIVPRSQPAPMSALDGNWFDLMYQVVTPDTLPKWLSETGADTPPAQ